MKLPWRKPEPPSLDDFIGPDEILREVFYMWCRCKAFRDSLKR
jgi:hypothetical protein